MDALKKYKTAKQCYFQIGGAGCTAVPNVGIYYDDYFCDSKMKVMDFKNTHYEYYNCDGTKKTFKTRKPVYICGKSILYLADSEQNVSDVTPIIMQIPGYDSNITYYVNIGTITNQSYKIHSTFKFRELDRKAEPVGVDAKADPVGVDAKADPKQVDAKDDKQKYHYIIIPDGKKELEQLYQFLVKDKIQKLDTQDIYVYNIKQQGKISLREFISDVVGSDQLAFFLKNKE